MALCNVAETSWKANDVEVVCCIGHGKIVSFAIDNREQEKVAIHNTAM